MDFGIDTSEVNRFSVVTMCHDTHVELYGVVLLISLLVSKCIGLGSQA